MTSVRHFPVALLLMALSACTEPVSTASDTGPGFITVPESISAIAAPSQNLNAVVLSAEDGCYYYQWEGPVETTFLPLRTREGNPICTRPQ